MNRIAVALALSLLSLSVPSMDRAYGDDAQQSGSSAKTKKKKKKKAHTDDDADQKDETKADSNTSAAIRAHKTFGVEAVVTPLSDFFLQYGARAYYQAGSDWQFGALYLGGSQDLSSQLPSETDVTINKATASGMAIIGYARYFITNSFSVTSGLGYRSATANLSIADSTGNNVTGTFTATSIVLPLAIGNHWTWQNGFTLGCDWAAVMFPITGSSTSTVSTNLGSDALQQMSQQFDDLGNKVAKITSLTLGLFSIGFMF